MCCSRKRTTSSEPTEKFANPAALNAGGGIVQLFYVGARVGSLPVRFNAPSGATYFVQPNDLLNAYSQDVAHLTGLRGDGGDPLLLDAALYQVWRSGGMAAVRSAL
jgi:hypothetical protein